VTSNERRKATLVNVDISSSEANVPDLTMGWKPVQGDREADVRHLTRQGDAMSI